MYRLKPQSDRILRLLPARNHNQNGFRSPVGGYNLHEVLLLLPGTVHDRNSGAYPGRTPAVPCQNMPLPPCLSPKTGVRQTLAVPETPGLSP